MENKRRKFILAACYLCSSKLIAAISPTMNTVNHLNDHSWSAITSVGYTQYQKMYSSDGQTFLMKLSIGKSLYTTPWGVLGVEAGVQNGNSVRIDTTDTYEYGGIPIEATIKPIFDVLATVRSNTIANLPLFVQVKGGAAFMHWQFDNNEATRNQNQISGEIQAGLGVPLNEQASLSVLYQGVFGGNPDFNINMYNGMAVAKHIPIQHGVLLSFAINV